MRFSDFIRSHKEKILEEWVTFARTQLPAARDMDDVSLRDSGAELLDAVAADMGLSQSAQQQLDKSHGQGNERRMGDVSARHAAERIESGFSLLQVLSEYRALRASVIRQWEKTLPESGGATDEREELTRFNEAIDQALTESLRRFTEKNTEVRDLFLGMLGHDLRNPLGAITALASSMLRSGRLDERQSKAIAGILNSAHRMGRMVNDLLDLTRSRLGSGIPVALADVDLAETVRQAVSEIESLHPGREVRVAAEGDLRGQWDRDRLSQVVSNLLGNAIQHGAEAPVTVSLRGEEEEVVVEVHNFGRPIASTALKAIFEPMVRQPGDEAAGVSSSLGLGLYIAREIVSAHGGTIEVASSKQEGTTFTVRLPRRPRRTRPPAELPVDDDRGAEPAGRVSSDTPSHP